MQVLTARRAEDYVEELYRNVEQRWLDRVLDGELMRRFAEGSLPLSVFAFFFRGWGAFAIEINTMTACTYQRFLPFFKQHPDLMAALGDKIADEFIHPKPPGHALILFQTAEALGISRDEILSKPMQPEFRGMLDFARTLLYEGTAAEWFARASLERMVGVWSAHCFEALTTKYGFTPEQAIYFSKHEEADLEEHDEGVMAHDQFNRTVLRRLLASDQGWERPTYGIEYCATTFCDLWALWFDQVLVVARREQLVAA